MAHTVIVTGAVQGIGAAIAEKLAEKGFNVAINCSSEARIENGGKQIAEKLRGYGVEAECFAADVSDYEQCSTMVNAVKERFGSIDGLVNNAGITRDGLLVRMSEEAYDSGAVEVQFLACNIVCRFVITVSRSLIVVLFILKREKIIAKSV